MKAVLRLSVASVLALAFAAPIQAQTSPASDQADSGSTVAEADGSTDIVVTARRREESLQDVPIAVSAISSEAIAQQGIRSIEDVNVPSLKITTAASLRNVVGFAIRGQRTQETQLLTDPAVGTYFAEVVQPRPFGFGQALYDLQSVQVLKGVQGTLFGRNVTGGAVLVEPNAPSRDLEGEIRATVGNYDLRELYGMINIPLGDKFAFRLAGKTRERTGFSRDVATGRDYDDVNYDTFRASLMFRPSSQFSSQTIFDYFRAREHGTAVFLTAINNNPATSTAPLATQERLRQAGLPFGNLTAAFAEAQRLFADKRYRFNIGTTGTNTLLNPQAPGLLPFEDNKNYGVQNRSVLELGSVTLKNIFGLRWVSRSNFQDYDGTPLFLITPVQGMSARNLSEEFQVQGNAISDRLKYTIGAYYFQETGHEYTSASTLPELTIIGARGPAGLGTTPASLYLQQVDDDATAETYAFYGAGTFDLTDTLNLSAGLRYNNDFRRIGILNFRPNLGTCLFDPDNRPATPAPPLSRCRATNKKGWDAFTWDATLQWEPNRTTTAYISTRKGFRAGGFSLRASSEATLRPFNPEHVQEYELGLKKQFNLSGAHLTTNASIFYQDYRNVQKQVPTALDTDGDGVTDTVQTVISNTAKQENYGGELEATLKFDFGLSLSAYYSYVDVNVLKGLQPGEFEMRGIPHHQAGMNFAYQVPVGEHMGEITFSGGVSYQSRIPLDDRDIPGIEPGYALAKFRLAWDNVGGTGINAAAFVDNAFNKLYRVGQLGLLSEVGFLTSVYGEPRTFGLELGFRF